jgi:hypothetical protein
MLKIPAEYDRDMLPAKLMDIYSLLSPCFATEIPGDICQTALADESGMMRLQMGTHNRSESDCSAWEALYDTTP